MQTGGNRKDPFDPVGAGRYSPPMSFLLLVQGLGRWALAGVLLGVLLGIPLGVPLTPADAAEAPAPSPPVPLREYHLYDLILDSKFLTSQTDLVIIERMTTIKLRPDWPPVSRAFFEEAGFFNGRLPATLVDDFVRSNLHPFRLEAKFNIGVRYRFIRDGVLEDPEVFLAPIPVALVQASPVVGTLLFSRAGFTPKEDQALVYVGNPRPDGSGGGFLIWLYQRDRRWTIFDTEVIWVSKPEGQ